MAASRRVGVSEARDDDLAVGSSNILFQTLSGIFLPDGFADEVLDKIKMVRYSIFTKLQKLKKWEQGV